MNIAKGDHWSDNLDKTPKGNPIWVGRAGKKYIIKYTHDGSAKAWWEIWDEEEETLVTTVHNESTMDFILELINKAGD